MSLKLLFVENSQFNNNNWIELKNSRIQEAAISQPPYFIALPLISPWYHLQDRLA